MDSHHEFDDYGLPPADTAVPDDARALDRDVQAYQRELRWQRRRDRWRRLLGAGGRYGTVVPLLAGMLVIAAVSVSAIVVATRPGDQPSAWPDGSAPPGAIGGPLPDLRVTVAGAELSLRELHPAVLALVPPRCRCAEAVKDLIRQSDRYGIPVYLVESGPDAPELDKLAGRLGGAESGPQVVEEPGGVLAAEYHASGLTAVLVRRDGQVTTVLHHVQPSANLADQLAPLVGSWQRTGGNHTGDPASAREGGAAPRAPRSGQGA